MELEYTSTSIEENRKTDWLGRNIVFFDETTSTQTIAHELATKGAVNGTIIIADSQTNGKGRFGRSWVSEKGKGIWFSIILRPSFNYDQASAITLFTSLVLVESLKQLYGISAKIKWPNDIYVNDKKCAGILTDVRGTHDKIDYMVIGIGMNTDYIPNKDQQLMDKAIALEEIIGAKPNRNQILTKILELFEQKYQEYNEKGFEYFYCDYNALLMWKGRRVLIKNLSTSYEGFLHEINANGHLLIKKTNGQIDALLSGEVEFLD